MFNSYLEYLKDNPEGYWFKAKLYGWGWVPVTWQGWIVVLAHVATILIFGLTIDENSPMREVAFTFILPVGILTFFFFRIYLKKGEKPRWQWGPPKKE